MPHKPDQSIEHPQKQSYNIRPRRLARHTCNSQIRWPPDEPIFFDTNRIHPAQFQVCDIQTEKKPQETLQIITVTFRNVLRLSWHIRKHTASAGSLLSSSVTTCIKSLYSKIGSSAILSARRRRRSATFRISAPTFKYFFPRIRATIAIGTCCSIRITPNGCIPTTCQIQTSCIWTPHFLGVFTSGVCD